MAGRAAARGTEGSKAHLVYLMLRSDILGGTHATGQLLPSEPQLAANFGVSRVTVRRATEMLIADGLVLRHPRVGTEVIASGAPQGGRLSADFSTLLPGLRRMGEETTVRLLKFGYVPAPEPVARMLHMPVGSPVQRAVRVRAADGLPFSHLVTHVPDDIGASYSEQELASVPLFRLLERQGHHLDHAEQTVSAKLAGPEEAAALEVTQGAALLQVTRVLFDRDGRGVEHLTALYRPDRFNLEMRINRTGAGESRHWAPVLHAEEMTTAAQ